MKKTFLALVCTASLTIMTACGGGNANKNNAEFSDSKTATEVVEQDMPFENMNGVEKNAEILEQNFNNLDYNIYLNMDNARVKNRNLMNILINESGNMLVNYSPCSIDRLKDEIKEFITPNPDSSGGPVVDVIHVDLLGDVMVSNGLICCAAWKANSSDFAMVVNEIAKAYAEIREDMAMAEFHKHLDQLNNEQLNAIRKAVPIRVTGIGEYVLYVFEVMADEGVEENLGEINNAFVEVCMEKIDDLERIKAVMDDFDAQNILWDKGVHSYYYDNYNVIEEVMAEFTEFTEDEKIQEEDIFMVVEDMPDFPGGVAKLNEYLGKNIKYPQKARESGIQGRVYVNLVVEPDGHVTNVKVVRGIGGGCDEEAVRVVKSMPRWKPGMEHGKAVRVSYNLIVEFKL